MHGTRDGEGPCQRLRDVRAVHRDPEPSRAGDQPVEVTFGGERRAPVSAERLEDPEAAAQPGVERSDRRTDRVGRPVVDPGRERPGIPCRRPTARRLRAQGRLLVAGAMLRA